jgi:hypothetical protein
MLCTKILRYVYILVRSFMLVSDALRSVASQFIEVSHFDVITFACDCECRACIRNRASCVTQHDAGKSDAKNRRGNCCCCFGCAGKSRLTCGSGSRRCGDRRGVRLRGGFAINQPHRSRQRRGGGRRVGYPENRDFWMTTKSWKT